MPSMHRRKFLGVAGAGAAAVSAAAVSAAGLSASAAAPAASSPGRGSDVLHFRAETGLPGRPWPAYATAMAEGSIDLRSGTGLVATRMLAGQPGSRADIGLPGTSRLVRITTARAGGSSVYLHGVVEDRSTLSAGESARQNFVLDQASGRFRAVIAGTDMSLTLLPGTG
jgi:hypothetical protein